MQQGSVLVPRLILICVNDTGKAVQNDEVELIADDADL